MAAIETLAVILALVILIKFVVILINPKSWVKLVHVMLKSKAVVSIIYLILAVIIGYYLLQSLTIVQIGAVMLFTAFLYGLAFIPFMDGILPIRKVLQKGKIWSKAWLAIAIWAIIAIWILYAVFV